MLVGSEQMISEPQVYIEFNRKIVQFAVAITNSYLLLMGTNV